MGPGPSQLVDRMVVNADVTNLECRVFMHPRGLHHNLASRTGVGDVELHGHVVYPELYELFRD